MLIENGGASLRGKLFGGRPHPLGVMKLLAEGPGVMEGQTFSASHFMVGKYEYLRISNCRVEMRNAPALENKQLLLNTETFQNKDKTGKGVTFKCL